MNELVKLLTSGLIGTIIGAIGTFMMLRFHYHELYAKTISESRNRWIDLFRENISVMLAESEMYLTGDNINHYGKYSKAKNRILIRLNEKEPEHNLLQTRIMELDNLLGTEDSKEKRDQFVKLKEIIMIQTRHILKTEWERVKDEACGRKR